MLSPAFFDLNAWNHDVLLAEATAYFACFLLRAKSQQLLGFRVLEIFYVSEHFLTSLALAKRSTPAVPKMMLLQLRSLNQISAVGAIRQHLAIFLNMIFNHGRFLEIWILLCAIWAHIHNWEFPIWSSVDGYGLSFLQSFLFVAVFVCILLVYRISLIRLSQCFLRYVFLGSLMIAVVIEFASFIEKF